MDIAKFGLSWLRVLVIAGVLAGVLACKAEEQEQGISGRYVGTQVFGIGQVSSPFILILSQRGDSIVGSVTPPFSTTDELITDVETDRSTYLRFSRREGNITFQYRSTLQHTAEGGITISGDINPLGCLSTTSGEPCVTDSNGNFTATRQ